MSRVILLLGSIVIISVLVGNAQCALTLSNTLGSNMVLQRQPSQAVIWGWDVANSKISVTINSGVWTATTGQDGVFSVKLAAFAAGGPYSIVVTSSAGGSIKLDNVMFGDVYICSGQSNMQFTVHSVYNATDEIALAAKYPQVRLFSVGTNNVSSTPVQNLIKYDLAWSVATPANVGHGDWSYMSGLCWLYGRYLADHFPTLPIGLISSNWGGTIIQAWSSPDALKKCTSTEQQGINYDLDKFGRYSADVGAPDPNQPSVLWNAMIVPFLKNSIKGALWYQGESNAGDPTHYGCLFSAMITDWRAKFEGQTNFPFFFVQLAPWVATGDSIPATRTAQLDALSLPNVGFSTAVDLGDIDSPFGNIHPRNKQDIAKRILLSARAIAYGENVVYKGPVATTFTVTSTTTTASVTVTFAADTISGGLKLTAEPACPNTAECVWYAIQLGTNWVRAVASLKDTSLLVISVANPTNAKVSAVKYAYASWPMCNLWNGASLPAIPFLHTF